MLAFYALCTSVGVCHQLKHILVQIRGIQYRS